jgi:hypothetical protein
MAAAAFVLSACGGGGDGAAPGFADRQAAVKPIAVGEPNGNAGGTVDTAPYVKLAQEAECADEYNRLYVIDKTYVFHARAGRCADNSYANNLYAVGVADKTVCTQYDSIAGPQIQCSDDKARKLFEVIVKNLDTANLGLDDSHEVKKVDFQVPQVEFTELSHLKNSGVDVQQNLVIKDAATFNTIWEQHTGNASPAPRIDFERGMVLAVFMGNRPNGCYDTRIVSVTRQNGKILVAREDIKPSDADFCAMALTSPGHLVLIDKTDEPVEFSTGEPLRELDARAYSGISESRNVVVKDQESFAALWQQHAPNSELPKVDFANEMVLAAFMGSAGGCNGVRVASAIDADGKLNVTRIDTHPGPATACIAVVTYPAHLVTVKRTDKPVVFTTRVAQTN